MTETTPVLQAAEGPATGWQPQPPLQAGAEMAALRPFLFDCVWTGSVAPNGMGPGSPEMTAIGEAIFTPILDGLWLACDCEQDQFLDGREVITWKAHFAIGWDPRAQVYKLVYADNNGSASLLQGQIEGDRFVCETVGDGPVQLRQVWARQDQGQVSWRNECSIQGGPWFLVEEYICMPA
jgi:hypothetical protein